MTLMSFLGWLCRVGLPILPIAGAADAAEVNVMISAGFYGVYSELRPAFEHDQQKEENPYQRHSPMHPAHHTHYPSCHSS
jgi:hypothetical protein